MTRRSLGLWALGVCVAALGLGACKVERAADKAAAASATPADPSKPGTIGLTLMTYNNPFFSVIKAVARKTAEAKVTSFARTTRSSTPTNKPPRLKTFWRRA